MRGYAGQLSPSPLCPHTPEPATALPPQPLLGAAVPCRLLRSSPLGVSSATTGPCDAAVLGSAPLGFPHGLASGLPEPPGPALTQIFLWQ